MPITASTVATVPLAPTERKWQLGTIRVCRGTIGIQRQRRYCSDSPSGTRDGSALPGHPSAGQRRFPSLDAKWLMTMSELAGVPLAERN